MLLQLLKLANKMIGSASFRKENFTLLVADDGTCGRILNMNDKEVDLLALDTHILFFSWNTTAILAYCTFYK